MRWFLRVNLTGKSVGNYSEITSEFVPSFLKKELSRAEISVWLEGVTSAFSAHRSLDILRDQDLVQILAAILAPLIGVEDLWRFISFV